MSRRNLASALSEYRSSRAKQDTDENSNTHSNSETVSRYYDIVTPFYEFGWGNSFHFSPRHRGESFAESLRRHEEGVGRLLKLKPGMRVADVGCGEGGPLTTIAQSTGACISGINNNARQINQGQRILQKAGLEKQCRFILADFMNVPVVDDYFDAVYSIEAICHARATDALFSEILRLLKPGGELVAIDWCLTECYDPKDSRHRDICEKIELGNATPNLLTTDQQVKVIETAGFEVLLTQDQVTTSDTETPWFRSLQGRDLSFSSFARTPIGRSCTAAMTSLLERLHLAPAGVGEVAKFMNMAADALLAGGELGIFTPNFLVHARKPL